MSANLMNSCINAASAILQMQQDALRSMAQPGVETREKNPTRRRNQPAPHRVKPEEDVIPPLDAFADTIQETLQLQRTFVDQQFEAGARLTEMALRMTEARNPLEWQNRLQALGLESVEAMNTMARIQMESLNAAVDVCRRAALDFAPALKRG